MLCYRLSTFNDPGIFYNVTEYCNYTHILQECSLMLFSCSNTENTLANNLFMNAL